MLREVLRAQQPALFGRDGNEDDRVRADRRLRSTTPNAPEGADRDIIGIVKHFRSPVLIALVGFVMQSAAAAQTALTFDVVSIRRSSPNATGGSIGSPPGRFVMVNMDLRPLIGTAYGGDVDTSDYIGLPGWAMAERYDIDARAPEGTKPADIAPMLRTVLAERFAFESHVETREQPIYELVRADPGSAQSSALSRVDIDCEALRDARRRGEKPDLKPLPGGLFPCDMSVRGGAGMEVRSGGMKMADFARSIQSATGRVIVDKTGFEGFYAFMLRYTGTPSPDSDIPSLFTALQEQLGLRLQAATAQVRVLVIDRIQRPTEN
jgi:uncharacterized protein (TIGR03435 family)